MYSLLFLCLVSLLSFYIAILIIKERRSNQIAYGTGGVTKIKSLTAAHQNLITYAPMYFIIAIYAESNELISTYTAISLGGIFTLGRFIHGHGLCVAELSDKPNFKFRIFGMLLTFIGFIGITLRTLFSVVSNLI